MGRASRVPANTAIDKSAILRSARGDTEAPRKIDDPARLRALFALAQGLAAWAAQFQPRSAAAILAAGAVGPRGIDALLTFIDGALLRLAPHDDRRNARETRCEDKASTTSATADQWQEARRQLCKTLNTFRFLREYVAGNLRTEPQLNYPYDASPDSVSWSWTWEPCDEEAGVVALARFSQVKKHDGLPSFAESQRVHDAIARHGRLEVQNLIATLESENCVEGFPRVGALIDAMPPGSAKARAKAAHKKFNRLTLALRDLVPEPAPCEPTPFGKPHQEFFATNLIERFVEAGRNYIEYCVPLVEKKRGSRQARRKKVSRWFAVVAQYAFLASGNGLFRWFSEVVAAVDVFSRCLGQDVAALLVGPSGTQKADEEELRGLVRRMNELVVEQKVLQRWAAVLEDSRSKKGASYYGRIIASIVDSEGGQSKPWSRGDVLPALRNAGLITAKEPRKKVDAVTDACCLMQQVGLAVQLPLEYLLDEDAQPPKRKGKNAALFAHDGLPWVVNPLGSTLAQLGAAAKKKTRGQRDGKRGKTKAASDSTAPRSTTRKVTRRKYKAAGKPSTVKPPRKNALPKAAKKWPRA